MTNPSSNNGLLDRLDFSEITRKEQAHRPGITKVGFTKLQAYAILNIS
jgi:hypothetical protein